MINDSERLKDISEIISRIEKYTSQGKAVFKQDELIQVWIAYHLEAIWEIVKLLSSLGFKNRIYLVLYELIEPYNHSLFLINPFRIDAKLVWNVVLIDLPDLKQAIKEILQEIE